MSTATATTPPPAAAKRRAGTRVAAAILGLAALVSFAVAGAALYGDAQKDDAGYLTSDFHRFTSPRSAIASDDLDIDSGGTGWIVNTDRYGKVRLQVRSSKAAPVFVGIARSADVDRYLAGTDHARVTDVDYGPFHASFADHPAARRPTAPGRQGFWATSSQGQGRQTLTWDVEHGAWSVVVMNADGSPGIDADVSVGANVPVLEEIGWTALGLGLVMALAAAGVVLTGAGSPRSSRRG